MACKETIEPGMVYHRLNSLFDGSWSRWHHCARCWITYNAIVDRNRASGDGDLYVSPWLNCGTVWQDAPKHLQEYAFMLPGEVSGLVAKAYTRQQNKRAVIRSARRAS